jgi:hypothetical protein
LITEAAPLNGVKSTLKVTSVLSPSTMSDGLETVISTSTDWEAG